MEKLTKKVIKSIVKECLVEILSEGINGSTDKTRLQKPNSRKRSINESRKISSEFKIDNVNQEKHERILEAASTLTSDPLINELLVDTARTTLPNQVSADSKAPNALMSVAGKPGADKAALVAESSNPEDLFGEEAAGKWAKLAFNS